LIDYKPNTHDRRPAKLAEQLLITSLAAFDLEEIGDHIAQGNPIRAGSFVAELRARMATT